MAEIELSVLSRQCLDRRIGEATVLRQEIEAWQQKRNAASKSIDGQFTADDARIKLKRLYPVRLDRLLAGIGQHHRRRR
jgi:hypothetical protein